MAQLVVYGDSSIGFTNMMNKDPYAEGYEAYYDDKLLVDCPYGVTHEYYKALEWRMGWDDAWRESLELDYDPNE